MSDSRVYKIFISHAWNYSSEYLKIKEFLQEAKSFNFQIVSVPNTGSVDPDDKAGLRESIKKQIRYSEVVVILAGMYSYNTEWLDFEMDFARIWNVPIIIVKPWDNRSIPPALAARGGELVGWSTALLVSAIKNAV